MSRQSPNVEKQRKQFEKKLRDVLYKMYQLGKIGGTEEDFEAATKELIK